MKAYSIYDNKAKSWAQPFYAPNKAVALRTFSDAVNNQDSQLSQHPEDFVLYEVATWDEFTGVLTGHDNNENLGMANDYINPDNVRAIQ